MSWFIEVISIRAGIYCDLNSGGSIGGTNAGFDAELSVDTNSESGFHTLII